jgi:hypothetical protein
LLLEPRADAAVARIVGLDFQLVTFPHPTEDAYAFAKRHRLGALSDGVGLVLVQPTDALPGTDIRSLLSAVGPPAPSVRRIGDDPPARPDSSRRYIPIMW